MKKILSMLLVTIMLFASIAAAIPANAATNDYVEALYFDKKPYIDGYITEAEWGESTVYVGQEDAATIGASSPKYNRFFYSLGTFDTSTLRMEYEMWLRWDEDYFYIGVKVKDPDGHSLKNGRGFTWNGDAFQCRIDPAGGNTRLNRDDNKPWSATNVCDLQFGYCQLAGGFSEAFDYIGQRGMTALSANPLGVCQIGIAPAGYAYSSDTANGITTYEIAVPWSYIEFEERGHEYKPEYIEGEGFNEDGAIDREYGMSAVVFNADGAKGANKYNALLSWGSGVVSVQQTEAPKSCGGSNGVILSGDKVSESDGYTGTYEKYTPGGVPAKDLVANYSFDIDQSQYVNLTYDKESDMDIIGYAHYGERVQDEKGNWVLKWDKDPGDSPYSPTDTGLNPYNYICTEGDSGEPNDFRWCSKDYSYTMEFDIRVTGTETFEAGHDSAFYTWFGGPDSVSFACGYFFDDSKFMLVGSEYLKNPSASALLADQTGFSLNEWHHWVFQYDNSTCVMRFYFDPEMEGGHVAQSAKPMFETRYRYFDYGVNEESLGSLMIVRRMNCQIELDNIQMYNFVDWTKKGVIPDPSPIEPGSPAVSNKPVEEEIEQDFDVTELEDGSFALSINNNEKFTAKDVTAVSFTVNYDASKLVFKGIDTLSNDDVEITDDGEGKAIVKIKNLAVLKDIESGKLLLRAIVAPKDGVTLTKDEISKLVTIKATVTSLSKDTGDTVIYVSAALVLVLAVGAGVVIYRRKRNTVEF